MPGTRWKLEARAEAQRHRGTATGCSGGVEADIASRGWWRRHFAYEDRARERGLAGSCRAGRQAGRQIGGCPFRSGAGLEGRQREH